MELSSVRIDASVSKARQVLAQECCPVNNETGRQRCLDVSARSDAALIVALMSVEPSATQYLFEVTAPDVEALSTSSSAWGPLLSYGIPSFTATFDGSAPKYCYSVRAKPLVGGEVVELSTGCVDNTLTGFGLVERTPDEVEQWLATCEVPTVPERETDEGDDEADEADQADEPDRADDSASDAGVSQHKPEARAADGCQLALAAPASSLAGSVWSLVTLLLVAALRGGPTRTVFRAGRRWLVRRTRGPR